MLLNRKLQQVQPQQANLSPISNANFSQTAGIKNNMNVNIIPKLDLQPNNFYLKSEHKMRSLQSHNLGNQILQFGDKGTTSRLKLRHKRYVTGEINKQEKQNHDDKPAHHEKYEHQNTSTCGLNIGKRDVGYNMTAASTERYEYEEIQNYVVGSQIQAVRKNIFNGNITKRKSQDIKTPSAYTERYSSLKQDQAVQLTQKIRQENGRNWASIQEDQRYCHQLVKKQQVFQQCDNKYCENITMTKTKPLKHSKCPYKSISQLVPPQYQTDENKTKNYTNIDNTNFNRTHKRKNSGKINLVSEVTVQQQIIANKNINIKLQNQQVNQNRPFDPKDTICYGRVPTRASINRQNSQWVGCINEQQLHNKVTIKSTNTSITNITNNRVSVNSSRCRILQSNHKQKCILKINSNRNSKNLTDQPTQSVQQQSQQSSYSQQNEQDQLQIRLGLVPKTNKGQKIKNSIDKIQNINNDLDLGMKIIDDSFQISGVDNDYHEHYHQILNSIREQNTMNDRYSNCTTNKQTIKYDNNDDVIVMDQSMISPQCEQLRNQLNQVLSHTDDIGSHRHIGEKEGKRGRHHMMGSERGHRYHHGNWLEIEEEIEVFEQNMQQLEQKQKEFERECQLYGLSACPSKSDIQEPNTFIEHNSHNASHNNVLLSIPVLQLNRVNTSAAHGQLYEELLASRDHENRNYDDTDLINTSSQLNGQMQSQMNIQSISQMQASTQALQIQLMSQQPYIDIKCGFICNKQTYTIHQHITAKNLPAMIKCLKHLLQLPSHPNYLQTYSYSLDKSTNSLTVYRQPLHQSNLYTKIYPMKYLLSTNTNMHMSEQTIRSIAKQLLSAMCQHYQHSECRVAVSAQDIYLVQYTKYNKYKNIQSLQHEYMVKIDKDISSLQSRQQDRQILSNNLNTLVQVITTLNNIVDKQPHRFTYLGGGSLYYKQLSNSFVELVDTHAKQGGCMETILTHPYIWSDSPTHSCLDNQVSALLL